MDGVRLGAGSGAGLCVWHDAAPAAHAHSGAGGVCIGGAGAIQYRAHCPPFVSDFAARFRHRGVHCDGGRGGNLLLLGSAAPEKQRPVGIQRCFHDCGFYAGKRAFLAIVDLDAGALHSGALCNGRGVCRFAVAKAASGVQHFQPAGGFAGAVLHSPCARPARADCVFCRVVDECGVFAASRPLAQWRARARRNGRQYRTGRGQPVVGHFLCHQISGGYFACGRCVCAGQRHGLRGFAGVGRSAVVCGVSQMARGAL